MAQGYYGSICIEDLFVGKLAKGSNGKTYVCIDDLKDLPFAKGKTNGKTYVGVGCWVNDQEDQFGNVASLSLQQTVGQREHQDKKVYIGNMKASGAKAAPVAKQEPTPEALDSLPF